MKFSKKQSDDQVFIPLQGNFCFRSMKTHGSVDQPRFSLDPYNTIQILAFLSQYLCTKMRVFAKNTHVSQLPRHMCSLTFMLHLPVSKNTEASHTGVILFPEVDKCAGAKGACPGAPLLPRILGKSILKANMRKVKVEYKI